MQATDIDRLADAVVERMRDLRDDRPLLTVKEAATRLGVAERTLRDLVAEGRIESVKVRGARRIEQGALDRYIESCRTRREA